MIIRAALQSVREDCTDDCTIYLSHACRLLGSGVVGDAIGEGMGLTYKAFAISSSGASAPVAFETESECHM